MKAVIIEDELKSQEVLTEMIHQYIKGIEVVACSTTVDQGVEDIHRHQPDIVFLDIELPEKNGFALFNYFEAPNFEVIFTTAYSDYAVQAFEYAAIDYVLKPINLERLQRAIERLSPEKSNKNWGEHRASFNGFLNRQLSKLPIPTPDGYIFIDIKSIIYLQADNNYTFIYYSDRKAIVTKNIGHWDKVLSNIGFARIHRSYMINVSRVTKYVRKKSALVIMDNEVGLPVSLKKKSNLLRQLGLKED